MNNDNKTRLIRTVRAIMANIPRYGEEEKNGAVRDVTLGRTSHLSECRETELEQLRDSLQPLTGGKPWQPKPGDRMRKKIIGMARDMGYFREDGAFDMLRLVGWCVKYGYLHKHLNDYTADELPELVSQFENYFKSYLKAVNR